MSQFYDKHGALLCENDIIHHDINGDFRIVLHKDYGLCATKPTTSEVCVDGFIEIILTDGYWDLDSAYMQWDEDVKGGKLKYVTKMDMDKALTSYKEQIGN